jgi:ubiquinone/menaquinone biosynthesis C-methylase UbiE
MDSIPVIKGVLPNAQQREHREMWKYESGDANKDAAGVSGPHDEPWLNVLDACEPGSPLALDYILNDVDLSAKLSGRILDLGAGTCWVTARLSQLDGIQEVVALDLSESFLRSVGVRIIERLKGNTSKIKFAVSTFDYVPFDDNYFDCVFMVASLHHSIAPIRTLLEAKRVLKTSGVLMIVESPTATLHIQSGRNERLELSKSSGATELCYTRGELEYFIRHAGFDEVTFIPLDVMTKNPVKRILRKTIRRLALEDFVLGVLYVITARKTSSTL